MNKEFLIGSTLFISSILISNYLQNSRLDDPTPHVDENLTAQTTTKCFHQFTTHLKGFQHDLKKIQVLSQNPLIEGQVSLFSNSTSSIDDLTSCLDENLAAQTIAQCFRQFIARLKGFQHDLERIQVLRPDPLIEKQIPLFLKSNSSMINYSYKLQKKAIKLCQILIDELEKKHYILTLKEKPEIEILQHPDPSKYKLSFIPRANQNTIIPTKQYPIRDKSDIDCLVKLLFSIKEFSWSYRFSGCDIKGTLACQVLQAVGVPENTLFKIWARESLSWESPENIPQKYRSWNYHMAIGIKANNGVSYILDPTSDPENSFTIEQWKEKLKITTFCPIRSSSYITENEPIENISKVFFHFILSTFEVRNKKTSDKFINKEYALDLLDHYAKKNIYCYPLIDAFPHESVMRIKLAEVFSNIAKLPIV